MWDKLKSTEPARWAELARMVLVTLVGLGWLTIDDEVINAVGTVVAAVASVFLSEGVRKTVTPVGKLENPGH